MRGAPGRLDRERIAPEGRNRRGDPGPAADHVPALPGDGQGRGVRVADVPGAHEELRDGAQARSSRVGLVQGTARGTGGVHRLRTGAVLPAALPGAEGMGGGLAFAGMRSRLGSDCGTGGRKLPVDCPEAAGAVAGSGCGVIPKEFVQYCEAIPLVSGPRRMTSLVWWRS